MSLSIVSALQFDSQTFTVYEDSQNVFWFQGLEACKHLELSNTTESVQRHVYPQFRQQIADGRGKPAWFVQEPGLYQLIFAAKTEQAEKFRLWVFEKVLPSIRKTGSYTASEQDQKHFSPFGLKINLQGAVDAHSKALEGSNASLIAETRRSLESLVKLKTPPPLTTKNDQGEKSLHQAALDRIKRLNKGNKPATPREISRHGHFQAQKTPINKIKDILDDLLAAGEVRLDESTKSYTIAPSKPS